ncbi:aminotransferase class I/II-fold pyridoxal phosphate-dependent enzyme, partial [Fibrobacterota bacterium]
MRGNISIVKESVKQEQPKKPMILNQINCDDFSLADFLKFESDELFDVTNYFWEYFQDSIKKKYMVYGLPITTAPVSEIKVFDIYSNSIKHFLNFCSYNYLNYSYNPYVKKAVQDAIDKYGTGAVSAPLLSGYYDTTQKLEEAIAEFKKKEASIVFPTGYSTNLGVLSGILKEGDVAVLDILSHASIYDGVRLAGAEVKVFRHNSAN